MTVQNAELITQSFSEGEWIFREGDSGDCAYLVERGEVLIALERDQKIIPLGIYSEGSLFGEIAIIGDQPRAAGAFAQTSCSLRRISRDQLNRRLDKADPILKVCISVLIGHLKKSLAQYNQDDERPKLSFDEQLQHAADAAVRANSSHDLKERDQLERRDVPYVDPIPEQLFERALKVIHVEGELEDALVNNELTLFYQPIIEADTLKLAGVEALMRWIHPERGLISPVDFIPIAERSGQMLQMTSWAIERACQDLTMIRDALLSSAALAGHVSEQLFMSVNFSSRDFLDPDLMKRVHNLLQTYRLPPQSLKIEVTESVLMNSPDRVIGELDQFKLEGASIAIDDFGTGYSSLSYLQMLPADTLKIDQAFIRPMHTNERHLALVESIIHLAQRLNMVTVAEGVENQEDADALLSLQCDYLQGYHFGRPMPLDELIKWAHTRWDQEDFSFLG